MADFETALRTRLIGAATTAANRIDWGENAQDADYPRVRLNIAVDRQQRSMSGPNGYRPVRVQIDAMARTAVAKVALRKQLLAAVEPSGTYDGVRIGRPQDVTVTDQSEAVGAATFVHRDMIDLVLWTDG